MLKSIDDAAQTSVARGCGFAALGIVTLMVGLSDQMYLACKAGGILTLGMCLILTIRGLTALRTPYKRTEVWVMLNSDERPQAAIAQQVIGSTLRVVYLSFAQHAGLVAMVLLCLSMLLQFVGGRPS